MFAQLLLVFSTLSHALAQQDSFYSGAFLPGEENSQCRNDFVHFLEVRWQSPNATFWGLKSKESTMTEIVLDSKCYSGGCLWWHSHQCNVGR